MVRSESGKPVVSRRKRTNHTLGILLALHAYRAKTNRLENGLKILFKRDGFALLTANPDAHLAGFAGIPGAVRHGFDRNRFKGWAVGAVKRAFPFTQILSERNPG
jgi:hypothetical protein